MEERIKKLEDEVSELREKLSELDEWVENGLKDEIAHYIEQKRNFEP